MSSTLRHVILAVGGASAATAGKVRKLLIHGAADRILPYGSTTAPLHERIRGSRLDSVENGPHGLPWTHADLVNRELLAFLS